jgi:hypothetical protein
MWRRSEWYSTASTSTVSTRHNFTTPSPDYLNLDQLVDQQCKCKGVPICLSTAYKYAQTLSMYWIWMSGIVWPQPCQLSTHHYFTTPSPDYPNLDQLVDQQCNSAIGCTHMPIHSIWMCSNTFYIYNMDVEKSEWYFTASTLSTWCLLNSD